MNTQPTNGYLHDCVYDPDGYCIVCNRHRNWLRQAIQRVTVAFYRLRTSR